MNSARKVHKAKNLLDPGTGITLPPGSTSQIRSQDRSVRPTLKLLAYVTPSDSVESISEFHMTVRLKVSKISPREASMLLTICNVRACRVGVDFTLYLAMEYLQNFLRKTGTDVLYVKEERIRSTLLVSELILTAVRGSWFTLADYEKLPSEVVAKIEATGWLPSERTIISWKQHWDLEKYLQIRIVPVEHFLERQPSTAERYSSYTRGYGQDGNPPAPHKTKEEPEDGNSDPDPPSISLLEFESYVDILSSIEINKAQKRQR